MTMKSILLMIFFALLPIAELRGAIPVGVANGVPLLPAALISTAANLAVFPVFYFFIATVHKLFSKIEIYRSLFERLVERARRKVRKQVDRYGYIGIFLFVAVPLPFTGAYTGVLGAWILGLEKKKTFLAVSLGVLTAGIIVTLVVFFGVESLAFFLKKA